MSEHPAKGHPLAAVIMVLIIAALCVWGFSLMNKDDFGGVVAAGVIIFGWGTFAALVLAKD